MADEWPRNYTPDELGIIARSLEPHKLSDDALWRLQEAAKAFQWGSLADFGSLEADSCTFFPSTNKDRRKQFQEIVALCKGGAPTAGIEKALNELDVLASQLLGVVDLTDRSSIQRAAECALTKIPKSGPDPKRARRQFIGELACIFELVTGKRPSRRVHDREYGPFLSFVRAALEPFKASQGCEADIKAVLKGQKTESRPTCSRRA
jgi:hypothetical protein